LSVEKFIAKKIAGSSKNKGNISKPIVKIGIAGIVLGVSVMILTLSIVSGFKKAISSKISGLTTHIAISSVNLNSSNEPEPIVISKDTLKMILNLPEVLKIQEVGFKNGILKTNTENEGILLKGVSSDYDFSFLQQHIVKGEIPFISDTTLSKDILISEGLAEKLELNPGDKMLIYFISQRDAFDSTAGNFVTKFEQRSRSLKVSGIYKTSFADFDNNLCFADLKQIRKINYWSGELVGNYEVILKDFETLETANEEIEELLGYNYRVSTIKEIYSNIFIWLDKLDINGIIIIVLMIMVAVINMITALLILILERTHMIGLVKAMGMTNRSVQKIFLHISVRLIGKGLLWGNVLGIGLCYLQYYFHLVKLDSSTYYVDHVAIDINWTHYFLLNIGTFLVCMAMLFFPTLIITRLTPVKTLRFD
jgi:lipoprotein-releasing system permease protein